jgi:hypothetical protein
LLDDPAQQRCFSAPALTENFRQPPARYSAACESRIERIDPRWQRSNVSARRRGKGNGKEIDERLWEHLRFAASLRTTAETVAERRGE